MATANCLQWSTLFIYFLRNNSFLLESWCLDQMKVAIHTVQLLQTNMFLTSYVQLQLLFLFHMAIQGNAGPIIPTVQSMDLACFYHRLIADFNAHRSVYFWKSIGQL